MPHKITLKHFQSFDDVGASVHDIARVNILIGPNNAGKSKILRAIDRTINQHKKSLISESGATYTIEVERPFSDAEIKKHFPPGSNYSQYGDAWGVFGSNIGGSEIKYTLGTQSAIATKEFRINLSSKLDRWNRQSVLQTIEATLHQRIDAQGVETFPGPVFYIAAERDVRPEGESDNNHIQADGSGVTNLFRHILTTAGVSKEPIEKAVLADLNEILAPSHQFSRIQVLQHSNKNWEIFLEEKGKGLVPLSQCGSGLRTIIHLLAYTNLIAKRADGKIAAGTFLCEELENCLHPHVQRNLFDYLDQVVELPARIFMTTHSSVCLDHFQGREDVVLTHVYQEDGRTRSRPVEAFQDQCGVLNCIGAKASDALQSNAVVWVEGPSDRIYLKKWIELCGSTLREGVDYSIMFYGGDILAQLTMSPDEEVAEYVRLLKINRNSAIIIDSDKTRPNEQLRETKVRVRAEAESAKQFVWITKGKEIENYITDSFLGTHLEDPEPIGKYDPPWKTLVGIHPRGSKRGLHRKVELATFVTSKATASDFELDWRDRTMDLIGFLARANLKG